MSKTSLPETPPKANLQICPTRPADGADSLSASPVGFDNHDWYERLVEDCKAIKTIGWVDVQWRTILMYWQLGERIVTDTEYKRHEQNKAGSVLSALSKDIGIGKRTIYRAINCYNEFPDIKDIEQLNEGNNLTWNTIITKYLPKNIPYGIEGSTGVDWYTPAKYINSVRSVLGEIDLDPASCAQANETVKAKKFYTEQDSGLDHTWRGRVFINPPYSKNKAFAEKTRKEFTSGNVTEAIVLLGAHAIETQWFAPYWDYVLCFTGHRIKFNTPTGQEKAGNISGSVFVYLGKNDYKFADKFDQHGFVVRRWPNKYSPASSRAINSLEKPFQGIYRS